MLNLEHILSPETKGGPLKVGVGLLFPVDEVFPKNQFYASIFSCFGKCQNRGFGGFYEFGSAKVKNSVKHKKGRPSPRCFQRVVEFMFHTIKCCTLTLTGRIFFNMG